MLNLELDARINSGPDAYEADNQTDQVISKFRTHHVLLAVATNKFVQMVDLGLDAWFTLGPDAMKQMDKLVATFVVIK